MSPFFINVGNKRFKKSEKVTCCVLITKHGCKWFVIVLWRHLSNFIDVIKIETFVVSYEGITSSFNYLVIVDKLIFHLLLLTPSPKYHNENRVSSVTYSCLKKWSYKKSSFENLDLVVVIFTVSSDQQQCSLRMFLWKAESYIIFAVILVFAKIAVGFIILNNTERPHTYVDVSSLIEANVSVEIYLKFCLVNIIILNSY